MRMQCALCHVMGECGGCCLKCAEPCGSAQHECRGEWPDTSLLEAWRSILGKDDQLSRGLRERFPEAVGTILEEASGDSEVGENGKPEGC